MEIIGPFEVIVAMIQIVGLRTQMTAMVICKAAP
jgi:hypothetical protein